MKIQIGKDLNGNQVAKVTNGRNSFTVQTNGNLPATHHNGKADFNLTQTKAELALYLSKHGTERQRAIFKA